MIANQFTLYSFHYYGLKAKKAHRITTEVDTEPWPSRTFQCGAPQWKLITFIAN
jgi:hypothetical protein